MARWSIGFLPGGDLADWAFTKGHHGLQCRLQVSVRRHEDADVVLLGNGHHHEVDCDGYVDALLFGPLVRPASRIAKGRSRGNGTLIPSSFVGG